MKKVLLSLLLFNFICLETFSQQTTLSANFNNYFTLTDNMKRVTNPITLSGANNLNDSATLQAKINQVSANGGGTIDIRPSNVTTNAESSGKKRIFLREVSLKNNVRIRFDKNIIVENYVINSQARNEIFFIGRTNFVKNVNITGINGRFTVKLNAPNSGKRRASFAIIGNAFNFSISQAIINDNNTIFASIFFMFAIDSARDFSKVPRKGLIYNIRQTSAHSGYGIVQMVAGKNILFNNLDGTGGITLRIETDGQLVSSSSDMTVNNIVGRNIKVNKGLSAVLLSPHRVNQGLVEIDGITATSSAFGAVAAPGFRGTDNGPGAVANSGRFNSNSILKNINVTAASANAQITARMRGFFRCGGVARFDNKVQQANDARNMHSVGAIDYRSSTSTGCKTNFTNGSGQPILGSPLKCYNVKFGNTTFNMSNKAEYASPVRIGFNELVGSCTTSSVANQEFLKTELTFYKPNSKLHIAPNPSTDYVNVETVIGSRVEIFNMEGDILKVISKTQHSISRIDTSNFIAGIYLIKVIGDNFVERKQLIIK